MTSEMDLTLNRFAFKETGIFSQLNQESGENVAVTLEHSYDCLPKLPDGVYTCVRGQHQLAHMAAPFETFEITGVAGHTNILFHTGNHNDDSEGCVLTGSTYTDDAVIDSRLAFEKFMSLQEGVDNFQLTVKS